MDESRSDERTSAASWFEIETPSPHGHGFFSASSAKPRNGGEGVLLLSDVSPEVLVSDHRHRTIRTIGQEQDFCSVSMMFVLMGLLQVCCCPGGVALNIPNRGVGGIEEFIDMYFSGASISYAFQLLRDAVFRHRLVCGAAKFLSFFTRKSRGRVNVC